MFRNRIYGLSQYIGGYFRENITEAQLVFISLCLLGVSSITSQIIIARELIANSGGNELVYGIFLSLWLFSTGTGSYFSGRIFKKFDFNSYFIISYIVLSIYPLFSIIAFRILKATFFLPGEIPGITSFLLIMLVVIFPYRFFAGGIFPIFYSVITSSHRKLSPAIVYLIDNFGDMIGSLAFTFILIRVMKPMEIIFMISIVNLVISHVLSARLNKKYSLVSIIFILLIISLYALQVDKYTLSLVFPYQKILETVASPYGNIIVTDMDDEKILYLNGVPRYYSGNIEECEKTIHYPLSQLDSPKKILIVSGDIYCLLRELVKYESIREIHYYEEDKTLFQLYKKFFLSGNIRYLDNITFTVGDNNRTIQINIYHKDVRALLYSHKIQGEYDAIIINKPPPDSSPSNRFYTVEFLSLCRKFLTERGVISLKMPGGGNYIGKEISLLNSAIYYTIRDVFENIIIIPGASNIYIASNYNLTYNIAYRLEQKNITRSYLRKETIESEITQSRINMLYNSFRVAIKKNSDFSPIAYFYYLLHWFKEFRGDTSIFLIISSIILIFIIKFVYKSGSEQKILFCTGFYSSSLQIILISLIQIIYGIAYYIIALTTAFFMSGLLLGGMTAIKLGRDVKSIKTRKKYLILTEIIMLLTIILSTLLIYIFSWRYIYSGPYIVGIISFFIGFFSSFQFSTLADALNMGDYCLKVNSLTLVYPADFFGAFAGSFLITLLIPIKGLIFSTAVLVFIKLGGLYLSSRIID